MASPGESGCAPPAAGRVPSCSLLPIANFTGHRRANPVGRRNTPRQSSLVPSQNSQESPTEVTLWTSKVKADDPLAMQARVVLTNICLPALIPPFARTL